MRTKYNDQHLPESAANACTEAEQSRESRFLNALPLVRRVAMNRLRNRHRQAVEDVVQTVGLNLWRWQRHRENKRLENLKATPVEPGIENSRSLIAFVESPETAADKLPIDNRNGLEISSPVFSGQLEITVDSKAESLELSEEEWGKLAVRAGCNEVSSYYAAKFQRETASGDAAELALSSGSGRYRIEGGSETEKRSLLAALWREMQQLSLRRRYALLLHRDEFVDELIAGGIATFADLARFFCMERAEFIELVADLPLADERIAELVEIKTGEAATRKQIWTHRAKAKAKLLIAIGGKLLFLIVCME